MVGDPGRRSRAWGVLAVALALMALVTALSTTSPRPRPARSGAAFEDTGSSANPTAAPAKPGATRSGGHPHAGAPRGGGTTPPDSGGAAPGSARLRSAARSTTGGEQPAVFSTSGDVSQGTSDPEEDDVTGKSASADRSVTSTTSTARIPSSPRSGAGAPRSSTPAAPAADGNTTTSGEPEEPGVHPYPGRGAIDAPATAASFAAKGGGTVTAEATWTGTPDLELGITCAGGLSVTRTSSSPLSLELDDSRGGGDCTVTLAVPPAVHAAVSYTLVISPAAPQ